MQVEQRYTGIGMRMTDNKGMPTFNCVKCDSLIAVGDRFCSSCGVEVENKTPASTGDRDLLISRSKDEEQKLEKFHAKYIDDALFIETDGKYYGKWKYDKSNSLFFRETISKSGDVMSTDVVTRSSFPMSDLLSIQRLSETKNLKGIAKGALVGVAVAGPIGAIAGGAYAGLKNNVFSEICLKDGSKIFARVSSRTYEQVIVGIERNKFNDRFLGIHDEVSGGDDLSGCALWVGVIFMIVIVVIAIGS